MSTTAKEVCAIVDRIERLHAERDEIAKDISDLYGEAKGKDLDVKALKAVISYRRKDRAAVEDLAARTAEYLAMVETGTVPALARAPAHATPAIAPADRLNGDSGAPEPAPSAADMRAGSSLPDPFEIPSFTDRREQKARAQ